MQHDTALQYDGALLGGVPSAGVIAYVHARLRGRDVFAVAAGNVCERLSGLDDFNDHCSGLPYLVVVVVVVVIAIAIIHRRDGRPRDNEAEEAAIHNPE